jgi:hypothetical protein
LNQQPSRGYAPNLLPRCDDIDYYLRGTVTTDTASLEAYCSLYRGAPNFFTSDILPKHADDHIHETIVLAYCSLYRDVGGDLFTNPFASTYFYEQYLV